MSRTDIWIPVNRNMVVLGPFPSGIKGPAKSKSARLVFFKWTIKTSNIKWTGFKCPADFFTDNLWTNLTGYQVSVIHYLSLLWNEISSESGLRWNVMRQATFVEFPATFLHNWTCLAYFNFSTFPFIQFDHLMSLKLQSLNVV